MWLLILEALAALALLLFFVWWTMFSGRRADARPDLPQLPAEPDHRNGNGNGNGNGNEPAADPPPRP